jgi:hypothetical protein
VVFFVIGVEIRLSAGGGGTEHMTTA